jgi:hypothetical protein
MQQGPMGQYLVRGEVMKAETGTGPEEISARVTCVDVRMIWKARHYARDIRERERETETETETCVFFFFLRVAGAGPLLFASSRRE